MKSTLIGTSVLASTLIAGAFWAGSPKAVANASITVEPAEAQGSIRLLRVGIPADGRVGDILRKNAKISSGFEVIDRRSMPAKVARATSYNGNDWSPLGADLVIMADTAGNQIKLRMYELSKGNKPVLSRGYPKDELKAANMFMNEIIKYYTGESGVFGSRIAYVRTQRKPLVSKNIQSVEMNGENAAGVTANRSLNILPSIGPGGQVLFTSYAKRNPDLWMSRGGSPTRVSKFPGLNLGGVMSPDGGTIAVALSKDGNSEIYALSPNGAVKSRLTNNAAIDGSPTWSTGGQLAFVSSRNGGPQVFRMSASGGRPVRVTKKGKYNQSPDWNQGKGHGQWIAYSGRDNSNRYDIFKVNVQNGKVVRMTQSPGRNLDPSWSPDGRLLSYYRDGGVYVANEDGNNQVQILRGGTTPDWGPKAY